MRVASFVSSFCTLAHRCKPAAAVVANLVRQVDAEDQVLTSTAVVLPPTSGSISTISCLPVCGQVSSHVKMPTQACKKRRPPSDGHFSRLSQEPAACGAACLPVIFSCVKVLSLSLCAFIWRVGLLGCSVCRGSSQVGKDLVCDWFPCTAECKTGCALLLPWRLVCHALLGVRWVY